MAKGIRLNGTGQDNDTASAPGYAGFMLAQALLAMLVRHETMTREVAGALLLETASSVASTGPIEKAAQRLLMDLAETYSSRSRRGKTMSQHL